MQNQTKRVWSKQEILDFLDRDDKAVERAVKLLHARQTSAEQTFRETLVHNGVGFSAADASYLSYVADYLNSGRPLSGRFIDKTRKRVKKYWRQLLEIANSKE